MGFVHGYIGRVQYHVQYTIYPVVPDVLFNCMRLSTCARNAFVQLEQVFLCGAYYFIMRDPQFGLV